MRKGRSKMAVLALLLLTLPLIVQTVSEVYAKKTVYHHQTGAAPVTGQAGVPGGTLEKVGGFETNLPIVVMDVGGKAFRRPAVWDNEKGYQVATQGDPYNDGKLLLYDTGGGTNKLSDQPSLETKMSARLRGFSSLDYDKKQYQLKFFNEDGTKNRQDVLGMGREWEWILNISFADTSLLRNYLCYNIAHEVMGIAPDVRFCEVFTREGECYEYQGLYLMMETVKQGEDRVPVTQYDASFGESAYILRRDRYDEEAIILDTYGTRNNLTSEYLSVKYPSAGEITDETVAFIEADISRLEEALFAEDVNDFLAYREMVDLSSFVDYFILNEFFTNYDANNHSVYMYKDLRGKLTMGPVWDFDQAIDNNQVTDLKVDSTAMHDGVWFAQMLRDGEFVRLVTDRYAELRESTLSDEYLNQLIDETMAFIKPAQERDWLRWQYPDYYARQDKEDLHVRLKYGGNHEAAVRQVKTTLNEHGTWLDGRFDSLYQFSTIEPGQDRVIEAEPALNLVFGGDKLMWLSGSLAILFLMILFASITLIQRE